MARCSKCSAVIEYVVMHKSGYKMPVNPGYVTIAEIAAAPLRDTLIVTDDGVSIKGQRVPDESHDPREIRRGRISHFATCPNASEFRRAR